MKIERQSLEKERKKIEEVKAKDFIASCDKCSNIHSKQRKKEKRKTREKIRKVNNKTKYIVTLVACGWEEAVMREATPTFFAEIVLETTHKC